MKLRFALALAATFAVAPAGAAFANTVYDARTLGMGGSSVGYSGNASLAFWNPASVGMGTRFGMYLPSLSLSFSNNVLSPADAMSLAGTFQNLGQAGGASSGNDTLFTRLGGSEGLNLQFETFAEPLGFSLGRVGPGNMAMRVYGHGLVSARATLSKDFAQDMNGLFFQGGFTQITDTVAKISSAATSGSGDAEALKADVDVLKSQLNQYMGSFVVGKGEKASKKSLDLSAVTGANAAVAATYAQPLPIKIAALPEAEITLGATAKVLASPFSGLVPAVTLPGGSSSAQISPVGGGMGANVLLDIDKEVTELVAAIDAFQQDQNLATTAELASKTGAFFSDGLSKSSVGFTSVTPGATGLGLDLGAAMKVNQQVSLGASLVNPLLFWNAKRDRYQYDFSGDEIKLKTLPSVNSAFNEAEPFVARLGGAWQPVIPGAPAILGEGWLLNGGLNLPISNGQIYSATKAQWETVRNPISVHLGLEKLVGPLALRLGTQQGGLAPLYTAGLGIQTSFFQMNLGLGADSPSPNAKAAALAFSLGAGF